MDTKEQFGGAYRGLRVLVTGDTGFKGSWLCTWLTELGATVIGFSTDSAPPGTERNFRLCGLSKKIFHVTGDVRNLESLAAVIRDGQPQAVFHFAAQPLVSVSYEEPKRTFDTNCGGTVNLFEAVRRTDCVRSVLTITTDKVYADQEWPYPYRENDELGGHDPYSASKAAVEKIVESYRSSWAGRGFADHPVAIASARGGNVIGGGDFARDRLIPDCMRALLKGQPVTVRTPHAVRPYQHCLDLLSGYLWLGSKMLGEEGHRFSQAWNFGPRTAQDACNEVVVRKCIDLWGNGTYEVAAPSSDAIHETFILRLDSSKAAHYLGWHATWDWEEALRATVAWFKEYQKQRSAGSVDMYPVCLGQISEYVDKARSLGLAWATA